MGLGKTFVGAFSIHAPTRGATNTGKICIINYSFQSTLPREERLQNIGQFLPLYLFSIHAPTRGATDSAFRRPYIRVFFNPRSHERSDYAPYLKIDYMSIFQSTLPREERQRR